MGPSYEWESLSGKTVFIELKLSPGGLIQYKDAMLLVWEFP